MKRIAYLILALLLPLALRGQSQCFITTYDEFNGVPLWFVTQIVQDHQGMMWVATWNGLNRYDGYQFESFKSRPGDGTDIPSNRVSDMMLSDDGNLLCLIDKRIYLFNVTTCTFSTIPNAEQTALMEAMKARDTKRNTAANEPIVHEDAYGTTWAIERDGVVRYRTTPGGPWQVYRERIYPMRYLRLGIIDRESNLWLCSGYGIHKLTFKPEVSKPFPTEVRGQIRCLFLDNKKRYWMTGRDDRSVRVFDAENRLLGYLGRDGHLHAGYTAFGSPIYCMMQVADGTLWMGSKPDGVFRLRETSEELFRIDHFTHSAGDSRSLGSDSIYFMAQDRRGRIWVATQGAGLNCIEHPGDEHPRFLTPAGGLQLKVKQASHIMHLLVTPDDKLLAASTTGLLVADISRSDTRSITFRQHQREADRSESLSSNATLYVAADSAGRYYVCTESGGLNQISSSDLLSDQLSFRHYTTQTGMPSDITLSAFPSGRNLIIVSHNQVIELDPDTGETIGFGSRHWQESCRFSEAEPLLLPDGNRLFGMMDGAMVVKDEFLKHTHFVPPIAITSIAVQDRPQDYSVGRLDTLLLTPSERSIAINFSALTYTTGKDIEYAYQFDEDKDHWNMIGRNHTVTIFDMRPGTHHLRLRSTNSDGAWVNNDRVLVVIAKPTFWETPWATMLFLFIAGTMVWILIATRRYIANIKQKQQEIQDAYLALLNTQASQAAVTDAPGPSDEKTLAKLNDEDDAFMKRAVKFIEEHIDDADINIMDMAEATATSRTGLYRKIKSLMGITPLEFIREARLQRACQLLSEGCAVTDVAYRCGFSDPKYFAKTFKARMGMKPSEYKVENPA